MSQVPVEIVTALCAGKLLVVWGEVPLALSEREPANRTVAINQLIEQVRQLPALTVPLSALPPMTLLSLDPTGRVEQAFKAAGVPLRVVKTRHDVLAHEAHNLLKLGGDLASRAGVVLSREGVRDLLSDADKRYLLDEAERIARDGAVIVIGADANHLDFQAWWSVIQPRLGEASVFTLGGEMAGVPRLAIDFATLSAELKDVSMADQSESKATTSSRSGGVSINSGKTSVCGDVTGRDKIVSAGGHIINAGPGATVIIGASGRDETAPSPSPSTENAMADRDETVDVAILTVLQPEYDAVCEQLTHLRPPVSAATNIYAWQMGGVACPRLGSAYRVCVGRMGRAGTTYSALATKDAIEQWRPRYIFFVGIAGGLVDWAKNDPDDIHTGDVVIADLVRGYEYGKVEAEYQVRDNWLYKTDLGLFNAAENFAARSTWSARVNAKPPAACTPKALTCEVASGDKVVDDPTNAFFAAVLKRWPKVKAVEMEGAGVGATVEQEHALGTPLGFMMIRGISDLPRPKQADEPRGTIERDNWKPYASGTAAAFTIGLIEHGLPDRPRSTTPRREKPFVTNQPATPTRSLLAAERASLQYQLDQARENLRLVEERISEYVMDTEVSLQLVKQRRQWQVRIAELEQLLNGQ